MKILVYGAGNIGCLYAALLQESGQEVAILARGKRLQDIREQGIRLGEFGSDKRSTTQVRTVQRLEANDAYDLILVILPRNHVAEVLPMLAANPATPSVMFFGNNAAGAEAMIQALGRERVLLGFPGAAAQVTGDSIRYIILSKREQPTTIGELDGSRSPRIKAIADAFRLARFPLSICTNMDAWLKTHAAEILPTACALYMTDGNLRRLACARDVQTLMLRGILEGYKVLTALHIPITPKNHRIIRWLPKPLLLWLTRRMINSETSNIKIGHALAARKEMQVVAEEFRALVQQAAVGTPAIDTLFSQLNPE